MTEFRDLLKRAADNKDKAGESPTCMLCPDKWEWGIASAYGNLSLCKSCAQAVFSFLAARLQGDQAMKVLLVKLPGQMDN